jgi:hypothetical protein
MPDPYGLAALPRRRGLAALPDDYAMLVAEAQNAALQEQPASVAEMGAADVDPFEAAAMRTRRGVRPEGGRKEGATTKVLDNLALNNPVASMVKAAYRGVTLPGDVWAGRVDPGSDEAIGRAADLAGVMVGGAPVAGVEGAALGSGAVKGLSGLKPPQESTWNLVRREIDNLGNPTLDRQFGTVVDAVSSGTPFDQAIAKHGSPELARMFGGEMPIAQAPLRDRVIDAYQSVTGGRWNERASLDQLRARLPDVPREALDAELKRMHLDQPGAQLMGHDNPREITKAVKDAAVSFSGEPQHMLYITRDPRGGTTLGSGATDKRTGAVVAGANAATDRPGLGAYRTSDEVSGSYKPRREVTYEIPSGDNRVQLAVGFDGDTAVVRNIKMTDPSGAEVGLSDARNALGPAAMRDVLRQFRAEHPEVKRVVGDRISGARVGGGYDPDAAAPFEMMLGSGATDKRTGAVVAGLAGLPKDEASVAARMAQMRYDETPFYRGEATGKTPNKYDEGGFFSRDKEYATGFAKRGGQDEPREFRLNLQKTFDDNQPLTAADYSRLVDGALQVGDKKLASDLTDMLKPGLTPDHLRRIAEKSPDAVVTDGGGHIRHAIEINSKAPEDLFKAAGYDALSSGRDVRKLTGVGIRLKEAAFDPKKADSTNIMAGIAGLAALPTFAQLSQLGLTFGANDSPYFSK